MRLVELRKSTCATRGFVDVKGWMILEDVEMWSSQPCSEFPAMFPAMFPATLRYDLSILYNILAKLCPVERGTISRRFDEL